MEFTVLIVVLVLALAGITIAMAMKPASSEREAAGVVAAIARQTIAGVQAADGSVSFAVEVADIAAVQASAAKLRAAYLSEAPTPVAPGDVCIVAAITLRAPDCSGAVFSVESQVDSTIGCAPFGDRVGSIARAMMTANECKKLWVGVDNRGEDKVTVFPAAAKPIQYVGVAAAATPFPTPASTPPPTPTPFSTATPAPTEPAGSHGGKGGEGHGHSTDSHDSGAAAHSDSRGDSSGRD